MKITSKLLICSALVALSAPAFAGNASDGHADHTKPAAAQTAPAADAKAGEAAKTEVKKPVVNPVRAAYNRVMHKMHHAMAITYTNNADVDFVRAMIPHHQGAIDMANLELKYGKSEELRKLAKNIISAQELEIDMMKNWLRGRIGVEKDAKGMQKVAYKGKKDSRATAEFKKINAAMDKGMKLPAKGCADTYFATAMIAHHQAAIDMAWVLKREGDEPELRAMLDDIIRSQGQEIEQMQDWLANHKMK